MIATKEQERKALAQIREIVNSLGENSYVGTAFEGCFEIAEDNIENDFACSLKDSHNHLILEINDLNEEIKALKKENTSLRETIEANAFEINSKEVEIKNRAMNEEALRKQIISKDAICSLIDTLNEYRNDIIRQCLHSPEFNTFKLATMKKINDKIDYLIDKIVVSEN